MRFLAGLLLILASLKTHAATISIIIDDVGDNRHLALRSLNLDKRVALSILPHTPFSQEIAHLALDQGNDILLHQPMESYRDNHLLGPGPLLKSMDKDQITKTLTKNLDAIPGVIGINNHMGSRLTEDPQKMAWVMSVLTRQNKFFIDSKTSARSVASKLANEWQVPNVSRHIFLDHSDNPKAIEIQFKRLIKHAEKYGHAVAIGHPKVNTLAYLEQVLPGLAKNGIELIPITETLVKSQIANKSKQPTNVLTSY